MAALGLTFAQIGIGATTYSGLQQLELPETKNKELYHAVSNSTTFPHKNLGYELTTVGATLLVTATGVDDLVADVINGSAERKFSFMLGAVECYVYVYGGKVTRITCVNQLGTATRQYYVAFTFTTSRSKVYVASSDATLWGG